MCIILAPICSLGCAVLHTVVVGCSYSMSATEEPLHQQSNTALENRRSVMVSHPPHTGLMVRSPNPSMATSRKHREDKISLQTQKRNGNSGLQFRNAGDPYQSVRTPAGQSTAPHWWQRPGEDGTLSGRPTTLETLAFKVHTGQLNTVLSPSHAQKSKMAGLPPPPRKTPTGPAATAEAAGL